MGNLKYLQLFFKSTYASYIIPKLTKSMEGIYVCVQLYKKQEVCLWATYKSVYFYGASLALLTDVYFPPNFSSLVHSAISLMQLLSRLGPQLKLSCSILSNRVYLVCFPTCVPFCYLYQSLLKESQRPIVQFWSPLKLFDC